MKGYGTNTFISGPEGAMKEALKDLHGPLGRSQGPLAPPEERCLSPWWGLWLGLIRPRTRTGWRSGRVPEWPNGPDCKSGGLTAYGGSNPPAPILPTPAPPGVEPFFLPERISERYLSIAPTPACDARRTRDDQCGKGGRRPAEDRRGGVPGATVPGGRVRRRPGTEPRRPKRLFRKGGDPVSYGSCTKGLRS
jgi:hypothetical protein